MKKRLILYIKLFSIFGLSFLASSFLNKEVFVANSPQVRENLPQHLASRVEETVSGQSSVLAFFQFRPGKEEIPDDQRQSAESSLAGANSSVPEGAVEPIAPGVYAGEREDVGYTVVELNQAEWKEYETEIDGEIVKVRVYSGTVPQEVLDADLEQRGIK